MKGKELTELRDLVATLTRATADGRMFWEIAECALYPPAAIFLCRTDWAHFKCWYSREEGRHHFSILATMAAEDHRADPEFLTADLDCVSCGEVIGILYRLLMDRFRGELVKRLERMRDGVAEINRKLVEALKEREKGDGDDG